MKKFNSQSILFVLLLCSISAHTAAAPASFQWVDTPTTGSGVTILGVRDGADLGGAAVFSAPLGFTQEWKFTVDPVDTGVLGFAADFLLSGFTNFSIQLDGRDAVFTNSIFGGLVGFWSIDKGIDSKSVEHSLVFAASSVLPGSSYGFTLFEDVASSSKVTSTPLPAAIWLFGSALLGIGALSTRRKSLTAKSLVA